MTNVVPPSFVLVGAPDTNKAQIAEALARDYFTEQLHVWDLLFAEDYNLGLLADYRVENRVMANRATVMHKVDKPTLYTHSLIDSLAYSLARVDNQQRHQNVSVEQQDSWALTMALAGCMLRDTFKADEIFYLVADFDQETQYENFKIEEILGFILDGFEMNYHIIDPASESYIDDIASVIAGYIT